MLSNITSSFLKSHPLKSIVLPKNRYIFFKEMSSLVQSVCAGNKQKIAICQITCTENKNENFNICQKLITDAKSEGAKVKHYLFQTHALP